jgi:hypothetical protein
MKPSENFVNRFFLKPLTVGVIIIASIIIPVSALSIQAGSGIGTATPLPRLLALGLKLAATTTPQMISEAGTPQSSQGTPTQDQTLAPGTSKLVTEQYSNTAATTLTKTTNSTVIGSKVTPQGQKTQSPTPSLTPLVNRTTYTPDQIPTLTRNFSPTLTRTTNPFPSATIRTTPTSIPSATQTPTFGPSPTRTKTPTSGAASQTPVSYRGTLCGNLTQNYLLTAANSPYEVTCNVIIPETSALTAAAGAIIKFQPGKKLVVSGTLITEGTSSSPVVFTSIKDDSKGGDTNHDGNATTPTRGDWFGIELKGAGKAKVLYSTFLYANNAISAEGGEIDISNSTFTFNQTTAISCTSCDLHLTNSIIEQNSYGVVASDAKVWMDSNQINANTEVAINLEFPLQSPATIVNNTLNNNHYPIYITVTSGSLDLPIAGINNNSVLGNKVNGLGFTGLITDNSTINPADSLTYVNDGLNIWNNTTLTINANTIIKSASPSAFSVNGTLKFQGTSALPIIITSIYDGSIGGNTDGTNTPPNYYDWDGIIAITNGEITADYTTFKYGGSGIIIDGGTATVTHSTFTENSNGITMYSGSLFMTQSTLKGNNMGIYTESFTTFSVTQNKIMDNVDFGFFNASQNSTPTAINNWWGAASGPMPLGAGNGVNYVSHQDNGAEVIDRLLVVVEPWLNTSP